MIGPDFFSICAISNSIRCTAETETMSTRPLSVFSLFSCTSGTSGSWTPPPEPFPTFFLNSMEFCEFEELSLHSDSVQCVLYCSYSKMSAAFHSPHSNSSSLTVINMNYYLNFPCSLLSPSTEQPIILHIVTFPTPACRVFAGKSMSG